MIAVTTIEEFAKKWGIRSPGLLIGQFVEQAPPFEGDMELAAKLGELIADLESALEQVAS